MTVNFLFSIFEICPQNPSEVLTIEPILTSLKSTESFTIIELFEKVGLKVVRACLPEMPEYTSTSSDMAYSDKSFVSPATI